MNVLTQRSLPSSLIALTIVLSLTACGSSAEPASGPSGGANDASAEPAAEDSSSPDTAVVAGDVPEPEVQPSDVEDTSAPEDTEAPLTDSAAPQGDTDTSMGDLDGQPTEDMQGPEDSEEDTTVPTDVEDGAASDATDDVDTAIEDAGNEPESAFCLFGGPPCPDGSYCATGGCGLGLEGLCTPKPTECEPSAESVCACDGNSYASACFAEQAGQYAIGPGPCPDVSLNCDVDTTGGGFGTGCDVNEYCFGGCLGEGFCKERPVCGNSPGEVQCACNGLDYATPCTLASAGKNLAHVGWCGEPPAEPCAGPDELVCSDPDAYCDLQSCQPEANGLCVDPEEPCPPNAPPECGCDNVTYENKCARVLAGVAFNHYGPCGEGDCELGVPGDCGQGMFCAGPVGDCTGPGICYPSPFQCDVQGGDNVPVCGCDGVSFESLCHAQKVDIPVASYGICTD